MATTQLMFNFLAAIPVGHRVVIEYYSAPAGLFVNRRVIDRGFPVIRDLDTGIQWASSSCWGRDFQGIKDRELAESVEGVVKKCLVSSHMGSALSETYTVLVVETAP
jgi:hypothetical protein